MIVERFPELNRLNAREQLDLAAELAQKALNCSAFDELSEASLHLLEERLHQYLEHPETGISWEDLRKLKHA
jgi:hypothetical protein